MIKRKQIHTQSGHHDLSPYPYLSRQLHYQISNTLASQIEEGIVWKLYDRLFEGIILLIKGGL